MRLGNTSIYRSQQGVISDSPNTPFDTVKEVSRFSFSIFCKILWRTPNTGQCHVWGLILCTAQKYWNTVFSMSKYIHISKYINTYIPKFCIPTLPYYVLSEIGWVLVLWFSCTCFTLYYACDPKTCEADKSTRLLPSELGWVLVLWFSRNCFPCTMYNVHDVHCTWHKNMWSWQGYTAPPIRVWPGHQMLHHYNLCRYKAGLPRK